jgi:hypothetical protein
VISWDGRGKGRDVRMGLNTRLLDHSAMADVPVKILDGDVPWKDLGEYTKPDMWISPSRKRARPAAATRRAAATAARGTRRAR